ncbi:transmembrane protein 87A-like isoform X2 [Ambystoma mexicanum]|uniref:transmembrane protein 87A-like isoform X2 n=1 Tax=Ambystoma mexicanum TaxID=8296 RepID=UPI0037E90677
MALSGPGLFMLLLLLGPQVQAVSEPGKWRETLDSKTVPNVFWFQKTMFNGTLISLKLSCLPAVNLTVSWYLRSFRCQNEIKNKTRIDDYLKHYNEVIDLEDSGKFINHVASLGQCSQHMNGNPESWKEFSHQKDLKPLAKEGSESAANPDEKPENSKKKADHDRDKSSTTSKDYVVTQTWDEGQFLFVVQISSSQLETQLGQVTLDVSMRHPVHQYTSASEWPLMVFYMVMVIVYVLYGLLWLVLLICYWRDILRIQYWIGGVILLGMLEKIVFYAEFQSIQTHGESVQGAVIFAEILCSVKRMLARVLVVIASLGYGIVKPRLGVLLNRVLGVGMLYLLFSVIEGILRVKTASYTVAAMSCEFALAFVDSCLVLWIFMSLVQTMKLLRLRRNLVKLSLYRHFTNTLIFAVIASVIFILWSSKTFRISSCQSDWHEAWLNEAFWRFLFSILLLVIMFLWRPSANNQRYAFVPLIDEGSEEEDEEDQMTNEGFAEGMKMRGAKNEPNGILKGNRVDEDLKWVEENIPSSMADVVLPPLLDSDEEIVTTKFEMSKME